ncbi:uncharacterized protein [Penaeus vannamei]|uniref:uncharacterized protein n=1 Tax=Penaeus vannamei TaxID=6689 RepID=UPI00387F52A4
MPDPPFLTEVRRAISKLKSGKAVGICGIPVEMLKAGEEAMVRGLYAVMAAIWLSGTITPDLLRGVIIPFWKGKGDRWDCSNHQGITLISILGKVLAHILLRHIEYHLMRHQRPEQSGFTPGKSTIDRILVPRLRLRGIPTRMIGLIASLYNGTESAVECDSPTEARAKSDRTQCYEFVPKDKHRCIAIKSSTTSREQMVFRWRSVGAPK